MPESDYMGEGLEVYSKSCVLTRPRPLKKCMTSGCDAIHVKIL